MLDFRCRMDRLLESVDHQASSAALNTADEEQFDEGLFQEFLVKNPVWDFHSLTKDQYLAKGRDQKFELMKINIIQRRMVSLCYFCLFCLKNAARLG